ncbi:hypothetical protein GTY82_35375 [Streptomyces sp. SID5476]|uniref:Uncharacterized protein n=1 Tax=Streptomyces bottropensis ATCC 25435 TaxID=1054862 RepID=M3FIV4_9ACTN|nr:hypothetical protein SBD_6491 [Streptomyces bottropensis ATCC 25435]MZD22419.1 hypothetical protein [Streptomyces sp. SID5476]
MPLVMLLRCGCGPDPVFRAGLEVFLLLDGEPASAESRKLIHRLPHSPHASPAAVGATAVAPVVRSGAVGCLRLRISATRPWRPEFATVFHRLTELPRPAG